MKAGKIIAGVSTVLMFLSPVMSQNEQEYLFNTEREISRASFLGPELKLTKIINSWELVGGLKYGYIINHKYVFGIEAYGTISQDLFRDTGSIPGTSDIDNKMFYGGFYFDYILHLAGPVDISFPTLLGAGGSFLFEEFEDSSYPDVEILEIGRYLVIEPKINFELNISRVFRLGIGGGYRIALASNVKRLSNQELSGLLFNVNLKYGGF